MQSRISVVMSSSLMDGGSNNVLVIFTDFARLASFHAAPAGAANPHRSWDLVGWYRSVSLVLLEQDLVDDNFKSCA